MASPGAPAGKAGTAWPATGRGQLRAWAEPPQRLQVTLTRRTSRACSPSGRGRSWKPPFARCQSCRTCSCSTRPAATSAPGRPRASARRGAGAPVRRRYAPPARRRGKVAGRGTRRAQSAPVQLGAGRLLASGRGWVRVRWPSMPPGERIRTPPPTSPFKPPVPARPSRRSGHAGEPARHARCATAMIGVKGGERWQT
jgi:hypothetical protein